MTQRPGGKITDAALNKSHHQMIFASHSDRH
jgi:hypothetical protein